MIRTVCPNCESQWGFEEMDWNKCWSCGWPDLDDMAEYDYDDAYDYNEDDQQIEGIILPPDLKK